MQISINVKDELLKEVNQLSKDMGLSRSSYINLAIADKIKADNLQEHKNDFVDLMGEYFTTAMKGNKMTDEEFQYKIEQLAKSDKV